MADAKIRILLKDSNLGMERKWQEFLWILRVCAKSHEVSDMHEQEREVEVEKAILKSDV